MLIKIESIDRLVKEGAIEVNSYNDLINHNLDCLMLCVTNTPIAVNIAELITPLFKRELLIIDLTTHDKNGTSKMKSMFNSKNIKYTVNPVMGGPVQSEEGVLGGIWGGDSDNFEDSKKYLSSFFVRIFFNFGSVEKAAQAKLLSNFLSLLTTTTVIEFFRSAKQLDIDINLLCEVAKLGSGNSGALGRIADKALRVIIKDMCFQLTIHSKI